MRDPSRSLTSPFALRGALEAFYGAYYTFPQRNDMLRFLGRNGFNFYMYGPKNDRQHRARWWDPYPGGVMAEFAETIWIAREAGVTFCYAISFGTPMNYASLDEFAIVTTKLQGFYDRGCRAFCLLLDDIGYGFGTEANAERFSSVAAAHASITNRIHDWARNLGESVDVYLCPTDYHGSPPFGEYLHTLGHDLHPEIGVFYTGPSICSQALTAADARTFGEAIARPPVIWDNYPANDLQMRPEMHIGPLTGRSPDLASAVSGYTANLMNQPEASKIPLLTIRDYLNNPVAYDPDASWAPALRAIGGAEYLAAIHAFAENSLASPINPAAQSPMTRLARRALRALEAGETVDESPAVAEFQKYLTLLDESGYTLKNRMRNVELRADLLPWIEALEERLWLARGLLDCVRALETGGDVATSLHFVSEVETQSRANTKRVGGTGVFDLADYVHARVASLNETNPLPAPDSAPTVGSHVGGE
jgi:hyaluronoglucosaminidase